MTGFLRRMVAGASGAKSGLNPMVGAMFSSAPSAAPSSAESMTYSTIASADMRPTGELAARSSEAAEDLARRPPTENSPLEAMLVARLVPATHEPQAGERPEVGMAGRRRARMGEVDLGQYEQPLSESLRSTVSGESSAKPGHGVFHPLVEGHVAAPGPAGGKMSDAEWRGGAARRGDASSANPRQEAAGPAQERVAEDIQIHIGRIEVIAVPPPAVRADTGTVRKSPSLRDYLKRQDGRPR